MPAGRPRGGNSGFRVHPAPMSERQQLALLLQMTSQEKESGGSSPSSISVQSTSSEQHRASRSRCRNERGETPLHVAAIRGDESQVRRLLTRGADPNAKDFAGWTPLHESCNHGWLGAARILIEAGASVNALGLDDDTPLHDAAINGHRELVKLLVANGGDPTLKNKRGKTAVDVAAVSLDRSCFVRDVIPEGSYPDRTAESPDIAAENSSGGRTVIAPRPPDVASAAPLADCELQPATGSPAATPPVAEDSGAPCEMRRTPPQNKVDRSGTGQSGSSPRVTLRLNQVRSTRDEKKGGGTPRQGLAASQGQNMDTAKTSTASTGGNSSVTGSNNNGNNSGDSGDVYEFKSSKEATPVRGASTSPNPPEKEKDAVKSSGSGGTGSSGAGSASTAVVEAPAASTEDTPISASPSTKRTLENDTSEEVDEENRRKKRKDSESTKEGTKTAASSRQSTGRNNTAGEKCAKPGKQGANTTSGKNNQSSATTNTDRKSPSTSTVSGSSPKPSAASGSTNSKTATPAPPESDGEDDRSKSSDSNSAPKVPPLKIVIPQSTVSEQEQGNRNGKNTSNRNHQLPYVVASSNSNDSIDKDQNQSASGTTSPTEGTGSKNEDKKDFSGALHGEERSTHHQRVLRSSHRSGNGGNGSTSSKEASGGSTGNGNYSNSSPLPASSSTDRSNNSSPQQRHHSPTPETTTSEQSKTTTTEVTSNAHTTVKAAATVEKSEKCSDVSTKSQKDTESSESASSTLSTTTSTPSAPAPAVELHPRKRKLKPSKEALQAAASAAANDGADTNNTGPEVHPHDQPITNCYQLFLNIRKQIERRRKGLFPVQPKPPQGFKDYLMNRCTYVLAGNANKEPNINPPAGLPNPMKDLYAEQEKERYRLRMQHVVEKEKLVLSVEQEILRVHGRAARALANQSLPFSVCTILKDEEVYNVITPEQEEKDRNARSRYNGRLFLSWLQDVDDKWEKIKEAMLLRHHNEAESLHAVQRMDWEWKLKEVGLCEFKARPQIEDLHVPMVHVSDDFDLLPA